MRPEAIRSHEGFDLRALQRVQIRELCFFVALAEELHLARAAQRVGITQSPLSKAISLLEYRMKVRLFHRTRHQTSLTEVGAALLPHVKAVLSEAERVRRDAAAFAAGRKGRLRVGIGSGLSIERLGRLVEHSTLQEPQIEFTLEHRSLTEQLRELRSNSLDVGIAVSASADPILVDMQLIAVPLHTDSIVVALRPDHLLAEQTTVRSLVGVTGPYLVVADSEADLQAFEGLLDPNSQTPGVIQSVASIELLLTAVLAGRGVGLLGADQARHCAREGIEIRPLGLRRARMTTHLLSRRENRSAVLERFIERAQRIV